MMTAEEQRLAEDARREQHWKRWGPYLAERQWGTVREDYSADARPWEYVPHDHARSRAVRYQKQRAGEQRQASKQLHAATGNG